MHRLHPHPIRLNREFRSDLVWWCLFVQEWNGVSFLPPPPQLTVKEMASDASGSWGCGAWHDNKWFQPQWDVTSQEMAITAKELLPIVVACALWGPSWTDRCIRCHCDNQAVVACLRSRTIHSHCMHMLRALAFLEAWHCFHLQPVYINTKLNHLADDLSRNNLFSCQRYPAPGEFPINCPVHSWRYCWIQTRTGPLRFGSVSSAIFSRRSRSQFTKILHISIKEISCILHSIPGH